MQTHFPGKGSRQVSDLCHEGLVYLVVMRPRRVSARAARQPSRRDVPGREADQPMYDIHVAVVLDHDPLRNDSPNRPLHGKLLSHVGRSGSHDIQPKKRAAES